MNDYQFTSNCRMKKIRIYKDWQHQKEIEIAESLNATPAVRIAHVVSIIKRIYPVRVSQEKKKIHFHR